MYSQVYITAPDRATARRLARHLVDSGLAACVNIHPIESIYIWKGKLCEDREVALSVKTRRDRVAALTREVRKLHPYEVPCVLEEPIRGGLPDYLRWVDEVVQQKREKKKRGP